VDRREYILWEDEEEGVNGDSETGEYRKCEEECGNCEDSKAEKEAGMVKRVRLVKLGKD